MMAMIRTKTVPKCPSWSPILPMPIKITIISKKRAIAEKIAYVRRYFEAFS